MRISAENFCCVGRVEYDPQAPTGEEDHHGKTLKAFERSSSGHEEFRLEQQPRDRENADWERLFGRIGAAGTCQRYSHPGRHTAPQFRPAAWPEVDTRC
jgi:hypothetical protein